MSKLIVMRFCRPTEDEQHLSLTGIAQMDFLCSEVGLRLFIPQNSQGVFITSSVGAAHVVGVALANHFGLSFLEERLLNKMRRSASQRDLDDVMLLVVYARQFFGTVVLVSHLGFTAKFPRLYLEKNAQSFPNAVELPQILDYGSFIVFDHSTGVITTVHNPAK